MHQQAIAIGPWILRHLQALVTDTKKGVFVLCFYKKLRNCHHEGCNKRVHRRCQEDWLDCHCYPWTREDPSFCQEHNEHYIRWVSFKAGDIPLSEIGCVEGLFLNPTQELRAQEHE